MTVVAWDGKTLAADRMTSFGSTHMRCQKIARLRDGALVGWAGNSAHNAALLAWFQRGHDPKEYDKEAMGDGMLLVVHPDASVFIFDGPVGYQIRQQHVAIGCAMDLALIAMACGKTAPEAVELASQFNKHCGGGVDSLRLAA